MKLIICLIILVAVSSCSETKLNGFGKAKLGMTIREFNEQFNTNYPQNIFFGDTTYDNLVIDKHIILKNVSVHFTNFKLTRITTDYNFKFQKYLEQYGVKENSDIGIIFNTDDSIFCIAGKKSGKFVGIGIIDKKNQENY